jgi:glycerol-3-phosphate dehydrogenase (NAD(P)+)
MGSAMCMPLRDRGHTVRLVGTHLDGAIVESVKATGFHPRLGVPLPAGVEAFRHEDFDTALASDTDLVLLGVSSAGVGWAIDRLCASLKRPVDVVMITKGMQPGGAGLATFPDHVAAEMKHRKGLSLVVAAIGGPCIAGELAARRHTGTVIASHDVALAGRLCAMLETGYYHPRVSADVIGVEACAAFKNFFAIAVGWAGGRLNQLPTTENRAFNHNAAAIIFDQAIAELMELIRSLGGREASVWGMPGAGDLYVTCQAGRNSRLGSNLGRGLTYRQIREGPMAGDTIEGAELGITVAPALHAMMASGRLAPSRLPLTRALLHALVEDAPLNIPWAEFHRGG